MVKKLKGTKLILGSHGTDFFAGDRFFARGVDASVSCSEYNSQLIAGRYGIKPNVIYNGIDPKVFRPLPLPDNRLENKFSLSKGDKVIIYVGRLIGLKGLKVLLSAIASFTDRSGMKLLIVGDGEERPSLQALGARLGISPQVLFAGFVPHAELPRYYSLAHIAVFPTLAEEAFGISICEAMACGVPVVATRVGGIPELVRDGHTGLLTQPGNERELAEKIINLLANEDLRGQMGRQAMQVVQECFTWEKVADRLLKVYDRLFT
jgi:glycosyltransferase involved in cell wall biosynthesis